MALRLASGAQADRLPGLGGEQFRDRSEPVGGALVIGGGIEILEEPAYYGDDRGGQRDGVGVAVSA